MSPITIVTSAFRRPYYLERQLDGWMRVRGLENVAKFCIALAQTDRYDDQWAVIERFWTRAPCPVEVYPDNPPLGYNKAFARIIEEGFNHSDFVFFTDEDILPADDVLELMSWSQEKFAGDPQVMVANAHSECGQGWDGPHTRDDPEADPAIVRLKPYFNMWGWGTWKDRWEKLLGPEWDYDGSHRGCDWNLMRLVRQHDLLCPTPDASRTQHIGYREGMFANPATLAFSDAASFREHRDPVEFRVEQADG